MKIKGYLFALFFTAYILLNASCGLYSLVYFIGNYSAYDPQDYDCLVDAERFAGAVSSRLAPYYGYDYVRNTNIAIWPDTNSTDCIALNADLYYPSAQLVCEWTEGYDSDLVWDEWALIRDNRYGDYTFFVFGYTDMWSLTNELDYFIANGMSNI